MLERPIEGLLNRLFGQDLDKNAWHVKLPKRALNGLSPIDLDDLRIHLMTKTARR